MPTPPYLSEYVSQRYELGEVVYWHPANYFQHEVTKRLKEKIYKNKKQNETDPRLEPPYVCTIIGKKDETVAQTIWKIEHCGIVYRVPYWELRKIDNEQ
tara:strand:- start:1841 stop:2137 length:297 start_codon:yes stop_codon:yes gene_type:complete